MTRTRKISLATFEAWYATETGYLIEEADRWWLVARRVTDFPGYRLAMQTSTGYQDSMVWSLDLDEDVVLRDYRSTVREITWLRERWVTLGELAPLNLADWLGRPGRRTKPGSAVALGWPYVKEEDA